MVGRDWAFESRTQKKVEAEGTDLVVISIQVPAVVLCLKLLRVGR